MSLEIFWGSGSPFSWRVLLGAEIKRLGYESRLLEFSKGHMKTPEFLQMNPRGKVPVVRDDGFVLFESLPILEYFEDKSPEVPLFGKDPREGAFIRRLISEFESYLREPLFELTLGLLRTVGAGPAGRAMTPSEFVDTTKAVQRELKTFDERVAGGTWIVGGRPSARTSRSTRLLQFSSARRRRPRRRLARSDCTLSGRCFRASVVGWGSLRQCRRTNGRTRRTGEPLARSVSVVQEERRLRWRRIRSRGF